MSPLLPAFSSAVYSHQMRPPPLLVLLLNTFVMEAGFLFIGNARSFTQDIAWKVGFFLLLPLGLSLFVWLQFRWSAAVCVFYATIGLAIDIATMVQSLSTDTTAVAPMMATAISGLFYFCLILFGWQSFLAADHGPMPPKFHPPNPPSPS